MTIAICPTRHAPDATKRFLDSYFTCVDRPAHLIMVVDDQPDTAAMLEALGHPEIEIVVNDENLGFFGSVNRGLERVADEGELVFYLQVDLEFAHDWHAQAVAFFRQAFPSGLGLISFQDGIQNGTNADQGLTTRRWLWVVFGEPFFPAGYFRYHGDSEFTVRSVDLGRYLYCAAAKTRHLHNPAMSATKRKFNDYELMNQRHGEWHNGGMAAALRRLDGLRPTLPEGLAPPPQALKEAPTRTGILLEYAMKRTGPVWYKTRRGVRYRGANVEGQRFADVPAEDAADLLASGEWKLAHAESPA